MRKKLQTVSIKIGAPYYLCCYCRSYKLMHKGYLQDEIPGEICTEQSSFCCRSRLWNYLLNGLFIRIKVIPNLLLAQELWLTRNGSNELNPFPCLVVRNCAITFLTLCLTIMATMPHERRSHNFLPRKSSWHASFQKCTEDAFRHNKMSQKNGNNYSVDYFDSWLLFATQY